MNAIYSKNEIYNSEIKNLLDRTEDEELNKELYGLPKDCLDSPSMRNPTLNNKLRNILRQLAEDTSDHVDIEVLAFDENGSINESSCLSGQGDFMMVDNIRISTPKLIKLITKHAGDSFVKVNGNGEAFYVRINRHLLLDAANS